MTEFFINDEKYESREAFISALNAAQEIMIEQEKQIKEHFDVSDDTASAIFYLRTRSRWTQAKENELIERDHAGHPISLGKVLSGEF